MALVENTGRVVDGMPQFLPPRFFQQQAADVKFGARVTPVGFDWDGDGRPDLLVNGVNVNFLKNVSTKPGEFRFCDMGPLDDRVLAGHDTSPTVVHWNSVGIPTEFPICSSAPKTGIFTSSPIRGTKKRLMY